jgi:hypothetical protein
MKPKKLVKKFFNTLPNYSTLTIDIELSSNISPNYYLTDTKMLASHEAILLSSKLQSGGIYHDCAIFKTKSDFYVVFYNDTETIDNYKIKIIYKAKQLEEVKYYINALKKIK